MLVQWEWLDALIAEPKNAIQYYKSEIIRLEAALIHVWEEEEEGFFNG